MFQYASRTRNDSGSARMSPLNAADRLLCMTKHAQMKKYLTRTLSAKIAVFRILDNKREISSRISFAMTSVLLKNILQNPNRIRNQNPLLFHQSQYLEAFSSFPLSPSSLPFSLCFERIVFFLKKKINFGIERKGYDR